MQIFDSFAREALFYVDDEAQRDKRFWCAFHNLQRLGLLYEVLTVWDSDPVKNAEAELQYTLYIHDRHARESEPYIQKEVHRAAYALGVRKRFFDFYPDSDEYAHEDDDRTSFINSKRFRFIGSRQRGAYPVGIFRLRFRARDRDTGLGISAEKRRCEEWTGILKRLTRAQ